MSEEMKNLNEQPEETPAEITEPKVEHVELKAEEKKPLDKKTVGIIAGAAAAVVAVVAIVIAIILGGGQKPHVHNFVEGVCACGEVDPDYNPAPAEKTYNLVVVTDSQIGADNKVSNYVLALVTNAEGKIVAARFDCVDVAPELNDTADALADKASVATKVELGDAYGMTSGNWAQQTKAFEDFIVGLTADEVANLDMTLVAGCTMPYTPASFKALVAKAFTSTLKVEFTTSETVTVGAAITTKVASGKVSSDFAGVVLAGGKVVASMIDSCEQAFTVSEGAIVAPETPAVSKNDQGEGYVMTAGSWAKQAQAFANSAVGKTVAELANLETVSDALAAAGCTMQFTTGGYKTTIIAAAGYAR